MAATWQNSHLSVCPDIITAVPLGQERRRSRGYNQAELLAIEVARQINIPYAHLVKRVRPIKPQARLERHERLTNPVGAFTVLKPLTGKTVLLIDDVLTTGATVQAVTLALLNGGAKAVYVLTAARAI